MMGRVVVDVDVVVVNVFFDIAAFESSFDRSVETHARLVVIVTVVDGGGFGFTRRVDAFVVIHVCLRSAIAQCFFVCNSLVVR